MADTGKRWILGCGLVGGLLALSVLVIGVGGTLKLREALAPVHQARTSWDDLTDAYGRLEDYVPSPDGALEPGRLQIFLATRERLLASQGELDSLFASPPDDAERSFLTGLTTSFARVSAMVGPVARRADTQHHVLMELGMGPGEYTWIAALAFVGWLGKNPAAVPRRPDGSAVFAEAKGFLSPEAVRHRYTTALSILLDNATIGAGAARGLDDPAAEFWRRASARLEDGQDPWAEGVPAAAAATLAPFRERLEQVWSTQTAALEWPMGDDWEWGQEEHVAKPH